MAKKITQYSIFISSPGDLETERFEIPIVVNELNINYGLRQGINLDVIKWETHSAPGISETYVQDLINTDIGDDYDLFIGMVWLKFGTKTEIANSGTEEEFLRAVERFKKGENIQILFYFKTTAVSIEKINVEELAKINKFKDFLKENKILYWSFDTIDELKNSLRLHIPKRIETLQNNNSSLPDVQSLAVNENDNELIQIDEDVIYDDYGLIDYFFHFEDYLSESNQALNNISSSTERISEELQERTKELTRISKYPNPNRNVILEYFKRSAKTLNTFSDRLEIEIPNFYDNFEEAIQVGIRYVNSIDKENIDQNYVTLEDNLNSVSSLKDNMPLAINSMMNFYDEMKKLPNIQSDFNKAKKNLLLKLEDLVNKLKKSYELTVEFKGQIEYKLALNQ